MKEEEIEETQIRNGLGINNHINPCPFCASKEGDNVFLGYAHPKYRITCINCDVVMKDDRKDKVIANWNRRNFSTDN